MAGGVLLDGDEAGHPAPLGVGAAHQVARALGGGHGHVDAGRRHDAPEADVEAVGEEQGVTVSEVRGDLVVVDPLLLGVGSEDHDHVGPSGGLADGQHLEALGLRLLLRRGAFPQSDDHVDTGLLEVQSMGVALRAVPDHRHLAVGDLRTVGIGFVVHGGHGRLLGSGGADVRQEWCGEARWYGSAGAGANGDGGGRAVGSAGRLRPHRASTACTGGVRANRSRLGRVGHGGKRRAATTDAG